MLKSAQELSKASAQNLEALLRFSEVSLNGLERLIKLQLAATKQSLEENARLAHELSGVTNSQEVMAKIHEVGNASLEKAVATTRELYEVVSQTQNALSKLTESHFSDLNKNLLAAVDQFAHNAPAGGEVGINALKSSIAATAAAFDSMTRAANQVAEFTDASVKNVSNTAAEAFKNVGSAWKKAENK